MTQQPTVGRMVHYYGRKLFWHSNMATEYAPKGAKDFVGPFAAMIVAVIDDEVNLCVFFPTPCWGSDRTSEIVEDVQMSTPATMGVSACWIWPPRVS